MMIHNGTTWVGYLDSTSPYYSADAAEQTDPNGPIVAASTPVLQSDGTALKNGDIWISTATISSYPQIYVFNANKLNTPIANRWELRDSSDQTTENGILFDDARWAVNGALSVESDIVDLLASNFLDPDAPDPALYPKGMLLWNLEWAMWPWTHIMHTVGLQNQETKQMVQVASVLKHSVKLLYNHYNH